MGTGIRIRFSINKSGCFISHLDVMRCFERSIRRANLPIAYSGGFHPMPRLAFASALPVGVTSEAEYADLQMEKDIDADFVKAALNKVLPGDFQVLVAYDLPENNTALMNIVDAADYRIYLLRPVDDLADKVAQLLESQELMVARFSKKGKRMRDIRPLIYQLKTNQEQNQLDLVCACGTNGNLRPMDILSFLTLELGDVQIHRLALWVGYSEGTLTTPVDVIKE